MKVKHIFLAITCLLLLNSCDSRENHARPNILFLVADDWSWPHASIYKESDAIIKTPNFDKIAQNGVLFTNAFVVDPSCSPSRAAILTGQYPHQLNEAANLYSSFPKNLPVYPQLLAEDGYKTGYMGKGWGPGNFEITGWDHNPAGVKYEDFESFLKKITKDTPFCFWFGSNDPHRPYEDNSEIQSGENSTKLNIPPYLPDNPVVKMDILNYYFEVQRFDRKVGEILELLEQSGRLENTIVVMTSDNGWPFPRAKATLYDSGTKVPLAISWENQIPKGQVSDNFISLIDLAPTFLEAAGIKPLSQMSGLSLLPILKGKKLEETKEKVFLERERHSITREDKVGYPSRAIRSKDFLYVRNLKPNRWPAGNPKKVLNEETYRGADVDWSPTKKLIIQKQKKITFSDSLSNYSFFKFVFDKRPKEELYDLNKDPHQLTNVSNQVKYRRILKKYRKDLKEWMIETGDPRVKGNSKFDSYKYYGRIPK